MSKRQLLFVTYRDENLDEGLSYTIELAKAMYEDIVLLLVKKKDTLAKKFENLMAGVAFAEAGEPEAAQEIAATGVRDTSVDYNAKITELVLKCSQAGIHLDIRYADQDVLTGIRAYIRQNNGIDKVVLSPSVIESEVLTTADLNRLVRTASRPIVTMTRQSCCPSKRTPSHATGISHQFKKEYA